MASVQDNTNSPRGVRRKPGGKLQNTSRIHADALKLDVSSQALQIPRIALGGGQSIPQIGLGTWQIDEAQVPQIVEAAIGCGYRLIDTAANLRRCYGATVGDIISSCGEHGRVHLCANE